MDAARADLLGWRFSILLGNMVASQFLSSLILLAYALVMIGLRRLCCDTLLVASLSGGLMAYVGIGITSMVLFGYLPGFTDYPESTSDAAAAVVAGITVGALYWCIVVRHERSLADARQRTAAAIRALE
jgi:membrane associated rhomboid family serine protease